MPAMSEKNSNKGRQHSADSSADSEMPVNRIHAAKRILPERRSSVAELPDAQSCAPDTASAIGGWMIALLWIMALAAGSFAAQIWLEKRDSAREGVIISGNGTQVFKATSDRFGQFAIAGTANGQKVSFLVDTGASGISIPQGIADQLGLRPGRAFSVNTANGVTTVYATVLDSLQIGPHIQNSVQAHINPSMDGDLALLGMSFLRHYELVQREGVLMIKK